MLCLIDHCRGGVIWLPELFHVCLRLWIVVKKVLTLQKDTSPAFPQKLN